MLNLPDFTQLRDLHSLRILSVILTYNEVIMATTTKEDKLITLTEAAKLLGVYPDTVGRWLDDGHIDGIRTPGGHRKVYRASVDELLKRMQVKKKSV